MPDEAPTYPEYAALAEQARREAPRFVSPTDTDTYQQVARSRGHDWCTAALGRPFPGIARISLVEAHLLLLADRAGINPPLPERVVAARRAEATRRQELEERRQALADADAARWQAAVADCQVPVEVRPNTRGRRYGTGMRSGPLCHAVPLVDAQSGSERRPRRHPAGRAVCETVNRAKPRDLGTPVDTPATCASCLTLVPRLRPAD